MPETARQRFIRNFGEGDALFRLRIAEAERDGDIKTAEALKAMRETWQEIYNRAEEAERLGEE